MSLTGNAYPHQQWGCTLLGMKICALPGMKILDGNYLYLVTVKRKRGTVPKTFLPNLFSYVFSPTSVGGGGGGDFRCIQVIPTRNDFCFIPVREHQLQNLTVHCVMRACCE